MGMGRHGHATRRDPGSRNHQQKRLNNRFSATSLKFSVDYARATAYQKRSDQSFTTSINTYLLYILLMIYRCRSSVKNRLLGESCDLEYREQRFIVKRERFVKRRVRYLKSSIQFFDTTDFENSDTLRKEM